VARWPSTVASAAVVVALVGAIPASAGAYSTPSGLDPSSSSSVCPPRTADVGALSGPVWTKDFGDVPGPGTNGPLSIGTGTGGWAQLSVWSSTAANVEVEVSVQDSGGGWNVVGRFGGSDFQTSTTSVKEGVTPSFWLPPGPVRASVTNYSGTDTGDTVIYLTHEQGGDQADSVVIQQILEDACYRNEQLQATQHSDLGSIDADVTAVKSAVEALTSGGTTLTTLDGDLRTLDTDVKAICASGCGGTSGTSGEVQLSSADRQLAADGSNQLNGDLWLILGAIVGCWIMGIAIGKLWP
jgi:hypothetical protein